MKIKRYMARQHAGGPRSGARRARPRCGDPVEPPGAGGHRGHRRRRLRRGADGRSGAPRSRAPPWPLRRPPHPPCRLQPAARATAAAARGVPHAPRSRAAPPPPRGTVPHRSRARPDQRRAAALRACSARSRICVQLLESELAQISWHDRRFREPLKTRVLEDLSAMDIAPDVAAALAALVPSRTNLDDPSNIPLALLLKHLPVVDKLSTVNRGDFRRGRPDRRRQDDHDRQARGALDHALRQSGSGAGEHRCLPHRSP